MPDNSRIAVLLAGFCGLRKSEVRGLQIGDFDFDHATLKVKRQRQRFTKKLADEWGIDPDSTSTPKSSDSNRIVPVPQFVLNEIEAYIKKHRITDKNSFIVLGNDGTPIKERALDGQYSRAKQKAKVDKSFRFHDLRKSWATIFQTVGIQVGLSSTAYQKAVGDSSPVVGPSYVQANDNLPAVAELMNERIVEARKEFLQ
jgi:integrase